MVSTSLVVNRARDGRGTDAGKEPFIVNENDPEKVEVRVGKVKALPHSTGTPSLKVHSLPSLTPPARLCFRAAGEKSPGAVVKTASYDDSPIPGAAGTHSLTFSTPPTMGLDPSPPSSTSAFEGRELSDTVNETVSFSKPPGEPTKPHGFPIEQPFARDQRNFPPDLRFDAHDTNNVEGVDVVAKTKEESRGAVVKTASLGTTETTSHTIITAPTTPEVGTVSCSRAEPTDRKPRGAVVKAAPLEDTSKFGENEPPIPPSPSPSHPATLASFFKCILAILMADLFRSKGGGSLKKPMSKRARPGVKRSLILFFLCSQSVTANMNSNTIDSTLDLKKSKLKNKSSTHPKSLSFITDNDRDTDNNHVTSRWLTNNIVNELSELGNKINQDTENNPIINSRNSRRLATYAVDDLSELGSKINEDSSSKMGTGDVAQLASETFACGSSSCSSAYASSLLLSTSNLWGTVKCVVDDGSCVIDGSDSRRIMAVDSCTESSCGTLVVRGITFTKGRTNYGNGGAINLRGRINIEMCIFSGNEATSSYSGAGIYIYGSSSVVNIYGTTFSGNTGGSGADIYRSSGTVTVSDSCPTGAGSSTRGSSLSTSGTISGSKFSYTCSGGSSSTTAFALSGSDLGTCDVEGICFSAGGSSSQQYDNNEDCTFTVLNAGYISSSWFTTERGYDKLVVGSLTYQGASGPSGDSVSVGQEIRWSSDNSETRNGFKICWASTAPSPTPPTSYSVSSQIELYNKVNNGQSAGSDIINNGDTVTVSPGSYSCGTCVGSSLMFDLANLFGTFQCSSYANWCVIDGEQTRRVFQIVGTGIGTLTFDGLKIYRGYGSKRYGIFPGRGGGIYVTEGGILTLERCQFDSCTAADDGAGLLVQASGTTVNLYGTSFTSNSALDDGSDIYEYNDGCDRNSKSSVSKSSVTESAK
ncbi:hypothetical protein TrVE_jg10449 [Triparma verrucosa]|uniref:Uncharacterized protein n=1 Tax=Triparma verrucosa TaxID=1606542 RepID=A0A9W7FAY4_9STRA|nr:hypothetical protein TrVE_jg10449 [Triparma verrucosa]